MEQVCEESAQPQWGRPAGDLPRQGEGLQDPLVPDFYFFYFCYSNLGPEESLGEKWEGRKEKYQREPTKEKKYLRNIEIKLFNIKAGKVLQNLVQSSPFMGGKTSKVDTLLV